MLRDTPIALDNDWVIQKDVSVPDDTGEYTPAHGITGITAHIAATLGGAAIDPSLNALPVSERPNKWGRYYAVVDAVSLRTHLATLVSDDPGVWTCLTLPGGFRLWDQRRVIEFRQ